MSRLPGTLYGVSLGPGDPGLITRQSWQRLEQGGIWTYPVRRQGGASYARAIADRCQLPAPRQEQALIFPMTHDRDRLARYWLQAAEAVLEHLQAGDDVDFLVEGDASTYSTFVHLARTVTALDGRIHVESLAGVTAYHAAAARSGQPLADTDDTVAIVPAAYGLATIESLLDDFDCLVLLKVKPLLDEIIDLLERRGLLAETRFIEKVGSPEERLVTDITSLRGQRVNYLSLLLVRNPQRLRGTLIRGCRARTADGQRLQEPPPT